MYYSRKLFCLLSLEKQEEHLFGRTRRLRKRLEAVQDAGFFLMMFVGLPVTIWLHSSFPIQPWESLIQMMKLFA
jgi:hypothetical protein